MPKRKSYRGRNRSKRRRKYRKVGAGTKALRMVKKLTRQVEVKEITGVISFGSAKTTSIHTPTPTKTETFGLALIEQGTEKKQRLGNKITLKSISANFKIDLGKQGTTTEAQLRLVIIQDRRPNGTVPVWYDAANPCVFNAKTMDALLNTSEDMKGRFQILLNKKFTWESGVNPQIRRFSYYKRFNTPVLYDGTTSGGSLADTSRNNFFIMYLIEDAYTSGGTATNVMGAYRTRYTDA